MTKAPFPWFGGKSKAAAQIWEALGADIGNYVEPFFGSGAIWLGRPDAFNGWATVNDLDGNLANFWRSMQQSPEAVAEAANNPVNECDLQARHLSLVNGSGRLAARLMADPDYCEPKLAGWWAWGACCNIGGGWCGGDGPWSAAPDQDGVLSLQKVDRGIRKKLPQIGNGGRGVNRQLPHLGDGGTGVNRQFPQLGDGGKGAHELRQEWLNQWFLELADNLRDIRVACGDWARICSPGTMTRNGICGVVMDPPYSQTDAVYANDSSSVSGDVRKWCLANGSDPKIRIVLCGHLGEHEELEANGWTVAEWDAKKGGGYQGADNRERLWLSPHCVKPRNNQPTLF